VKKPGKEDLAGWVAFALKKALTKDNIMKGFMTTGIWPLDSITMDQKIGPSETYGRSG